MNVQKLVRGNVNPFDQTHSDGWFCVHRSGSQEEEEAERQPAEPRWRMCVHRWLEVQWRPIERPKWTGQLWQLEFVQVRQPPREDVFSAARSSSCGANSDFQWPNRSGCRRGVSCEQELNGEIEIRVGGVKCTDRDFAISCIRLLQAFHRLRSSHI